MLFQISALLSDFVFINNDEWQSNSPDSIHWNYWE